MVKHYEIKQKTKKALEFVDITNKIKKFVKASKISNGFVNIQSKHTTATILVNENEPLFIKDAQKKFREMFPKAGDYGHNNFKIRTVICVKTNVKTVILMWAHFLLVHRRR